MLSSQLVHNINHQGSNINWKCHHKILQRVSYPFHFIWWLSAVELIVSNKCKISHCTHECTMWNSHTPCLSLHQASTYHCENWTHITNGDWGTSLWWLGTPCCVMGIKQRMPKARIGSTLIKHLTSSICWMLQILQGFFTQSSVLRSLSCIRFRNIKNNYGLIKLSILRRELYL